MEFDSLGRGSGPKESASHRCCCAGGGVVERTPVDGLAEAPDGPGPMAAVGRGASAATSLRIGGRLVRVLAELTASPALPLDRIDNVLPGDRGPGREVEGGLDIGIVGGEV